MEVSFCFSVITRRLKGTMAAAKPEGQTVTLDKLPEENVIYMGAAPRQTALCAFVFEDRAEAAAERRLAVMKKILIIEDDTDINHMTAEALKKAGYSCVQAFSGTEGLLYAKNEPFDMVILDLMLPGMNGEALLPRVKELQAVPVLVISARDSLDSKVELLNAGAEDYLTKPFAIQELIARVGVQIRRFSGGTSREEMEGNNLSHKDLRLCTRSMTASVRGQELDLTRQEFRILELLLSHPDRVFTKQDIYDYAWDDLYMGEDKTINVHISNIRKKLKALSDQDYIETVWGVGFRLAR